MKKVLIIGGMSLCILFISNTFASPRQVVVFEEVTTTVGWPYCPGAAVSLHQLEVNKKDSVAIISLHVQYQGTTNPFRTTETSSRALSYYAPSGLPTGYCDGSTPIVGAQPYSTFLSAFNTKKTVASPLTIELTGSYNSSSKTGTINAHITNTSGNTVSGTFQCILAETNIPYTWYDQDSVFHVARDLIPDQNGEAVSINAGTSVDKTRNFTISTGWKPNDCYIVVFVQGSTKEIYQAAKIKIPNIAVQENKETSRISLKAEPNPFNNQTTINYYTPKTSKMTLEIYDITGEVVKVLINKTESQGRKQIVWNGTDNKNIKVPTGMYFIKLRNENSSLIKKIIVLR